MKKIQIQENFNILIQALDIATQKGCFGLADASNIFKAVQSVGQFINEAPQEKAEGLQKEVITPKEKDQ